MKKCPFCAEEIQDAAKVCKHCGRDLVNQDTAQSVRVVQPEKKGLSAVAWLLIAVAALVVVAAIGNGMNPSVPSELTVEQRTATMDAFKKGGRVPPDVIEVASNAIRLHELPRERQRATAGYRPHQTVRLRATD